MVGRKSLRVRLGWLFATLCLFSQPLALAESVYDLGSDQRTMAAPAAGSIRVGEAVRNVQPGESLTAGELAALHQVISSGRQVLALNALGAAVSGNVNLVSDIGRDASSLVIPRGVVALGDFSKIAGLNFTGNLVNSGSLFGYSTSVATTTANISAANIFNNQGALLSTVLPAGLLGLTNAIAKVDLNLQATNEIVNAGTITSSGALNLNTSQLTNSGLIQSVNGDINILAKGNENLAVFASGGRFFAAGNINVGDVTSYAKFNTKLSGGDWHANQLNIHSGDGHVTANLNDVTALVSVYAGGAHVYANTDNLRVGEFALTGDPTISNTGDLTLAGSISTGGGPLALIAGGNINAGSATEISTANPNGDGGNIIIVAGAEFTINGNDLDITGGSATGGNVNLGTLDSMSSRGGDGTAAADGGNVQIVAFGGTGTGSVSLPDIFTGGSTTGTNGNLEVIAGSNNAGSSLVVKGVDTAGGTAGSGNILFFAAAPTLPDGKVTIDNTPVTGGAVTFGSIVPGATSTQGGVEIADSITANELTIVSSGVDLNDQLTVSGQLIIVASEVSLTSTTVTSPVVSISSPSTLTLSSNATFNAETTNLSAGGNTGGIVFVGSGQTSFTGTVNAFAVNDGQSIDFGQATILSPGSVSLYTSNVSGINAIGASVVQVNPNGTGTIQNATGDVVLPSKFEYIGKDLAILASGNVIASGATSSIKLSNPDGRAGNLTVIAGYDFTFTPGLISGGFLNQEVPFSEPKSGVATITGPSVTGGSVLMPKTSIVANATSTGPSDIGGHSGGTVTVVANGGTQNAGLIALGDISTTSKRGVGGPVMLIGEGGVSTGSIKTTGQSGGKVTIGGVTPQISGGTFSLNNGVVSGTGQFVGSTPAATNGAAILVKGSIDTSGLSLRGGDVNLSADGQIEVAGGIRSNGVSAPNNLTTAGGKVTINSLQSKVCVGTAGINTSAFLLKDMPGGGDAGDISISAGSFISTGRLIARGANRSNPGEGGAGGNISVQTTATTSVGGVPYNVGAVKVNGFIDSRGGNASKTDDGDGGKGGNVVLTSAVVSINGFVDGASIIASGGAKGGNGGAGDPGVGGNISIDTFSIQPLPSSLDLTSTTRNIVKQPGGMFSLGYANPINGVSAKIVSDGYYVDKVNTGNGMLTAPGVSWGSIDIDVTGADPLVSGKRVLLTPSQAIVQYQSDRGQVVNPLTVNAAGQAQSGEFTIDQAELNVVNFTGFKIPNQNITLHITGNRPILNLPSSIMLSGILDFAGTSGTNYINLGSGNLKVNAGAQILSSSSSKLILSGTGGTYTNRGTIIAGDLVLARTSTAALTFVGAAGSNTQVDGVLLGPSVDVGMRFTFKSQAANNMDMPVEFADVPLPLSYKTDALAFAANANLARTVMVNLSLGEMSGATFVPVVAEISGTLSGSLVGEVSVAGVKTTVTGFSPVLTPLSLGDDTSITSGKKLLINSVGDIQIGDGVDLKGGQFANPSYNPGALIAPIRLKAAGSIEISSAGVNGVSIGSGGSFTSIGRNIVVTASAGDVDIGSANVIKAYGGNIVVLAKGSVTGGDNNSFYALGMENSPTGGIEIGSGLTSSKLNSAFGLSFGTQPDSITSLGNVNVSGSGPIVLNDSGGGIVNLGTATLDLTRRGAMVFDAVGAAASVTFGVGNTFTTFSSKPIAFMSTIAPNANVFTFASDEQIDDTTSGAKVSGAAGSQIAMDDEGIKLFDGEIFVEATAPTSIETAHGLVEIKKGALVHVDMRNGNAHVKACGNAGDVVVYGYNHKFPIAPGQEVILTGHAPAQSDLLPADGVGRRNQETKKLEDGGHVIMSDFSILTVISHQSALKNKPENKRVVDRMLKTAAALDMITKARGAYVATPRQAAKRHNNVEAPGYAASGNHLSPVSYNEQ